MRNLRVAMRRLRQRPGYGVTIVLVLALGIGVNSAMFSITKGVLLEPLPYSSPDQLAFIWNQFPGSGEDQIRISPPELADWRQQNEIFERVAGINTSEQMAAWTLTFGDETEVHSGAYVSANLFDVLGVGAAMGRTFAPGEEIEGQDMVVVLSDQLWRNRFGADPAIVGQAAVIRGDSRVIIGVMPSGFHTNFNVMGARQADLWVPLVLPLDSSREGRFLNVIGRLAPGVDLTRANAQAAAVATGFKETYPDAYAEDSSYGIHLESVPHRVVGEVRTPLLVLFGAVGILLLIACLNVVNLLLVMGEYRQQEIAVRIALGTSWRRIARLFVTEALLLTGAGAVVGLAVGYGGIAFVRTFNPGGIPRIELVQMDTSVIAFTAVLAIVVGILVGILPALHAARTDVVTTLKEGSRSSSGNRSRQRLRRALVVSEVALAVVLVVGAGLFARSFRELAAIDLGIDPENVVSLRIDYPGWQYPDIEQVELINRQILDRVQPIAGVRSASLAHAEHPLRLNGRWYFRVEGRPIDPDTSRPLVGIRIVSPGHFTTLQIPLVRGRLFDEFDRNPERLVILINESMAERWFPDEDPIGKQLKLWGDADPRPYEIVGVVGDVKNEGIREHVRETILLPVSNAGFATGWQRHMTLHVRAAGEPTALVGSVRSAMSEVDGKLFVSNVQTLQGVVAGTVAGPRFVTLLTTVFAGLALIMASIGIYGVISYTVARRTPELGIRMALGAGSPRVLGLVLRQGVALAGLGVAAGLVASVAVSSLIRSMLYAISPTDPWTYGSVALFLVAVASLASFVPAYRASRIQPVVALRHE
ncbi:MAG: ABC transporter permease [Gemmatimonadota bacterium]